MILYHGTSIKYADIIMKEGFKTRGESGNDNWTHTISSQEDFIYLTVAYPFHFAYAAAEENDKSGSVIQVEVNEEDLFPDEDFVRQANKIDNNIPIDIRDYQQYGLLSLRALGNCAVMPEAIKVLGRKDYEFAPMLRYSDPTISLINFALLGEYYKELVRMWWNDEDYGNIKQDELMHKSLEARKQLKKELDNES